MTRHGPREPAVPVAEASSSRASDSITAATTQQSGGDQDSEVPFAGEVVKWIETLVESFRTGGIKKSQAIFKIGQVLAEDSRGDDQLKADSLDRYSATLDRIEALANESNERGLRFTIPSPDKGKKRSGEGDQRLEESNGDNAVSNIIDVDDFFQGLPKGNKHLLEGDNPGGGFGDDSEKDSDDGVDDSRRGRSNKKQRIYESEMPWFKAEQQFRIGNANPSCNKTRDTLDLFQRDPVTVKRWIRCASSAPAGFPNSEWDSLIKGESVDLDTVFSSLHHIHSIDEGVGRVGTTEIQFGRPKPAAKVRLSEVRSGSRSRCSGPGPRIVGPGPVDVRTGLQVRTWSGPGPSGR